MKGIGTMAIVIMLVSVTGAAIISVIIFSALSISTLLAVLAGITAVLGGITSLDEGHHLIAVPYIALSALCLIMSLAF